MSVNISLRIKNLTETLSSFRLWDLPYFIKNDGWKILIEKMFLHDDFHFFNKISFLIFSLWG